jgi:hypothetical protein
MKRMHLFSRALAIILFCLTFCAFAQPILAHEDQAQTVGHYNVAVDQTPLSPLKDEKVSLSFLLEDLSGHHPVANMSGEISIKDITSGEKTILKKRLKADAHGETEFDYTFTKAGMYDVEYDWKDAHGEYNTGREIQVREPASFFDPTDFQSNVWFLVGLMLVGMIIGAAIMFVLLTTTLHPKK